MSQIGTYPTMESLERSLERFEELVVASREKGGDSVDRALRRGSTDTTSILALQHLLLLLGFGPVSEERVPEFSGVYGEATVAAVAELAARTGGGEDGTRVSNPLGEKILELSREVAGARDRLIRELAASEFEEIELGTRDKERAIAVQSLLLAVGGQVRSDGRFEADGGFGNVTKSSIREFARRRLMTIEGRPADGSRVTSKIARGLVESILRRFGGVEPKVEQPPTEQPDATALAGREGREASLDELLTDLASSPAAAPGRSAHDVLEELGERATEAVSLSVESANLSGRLLDVEPIGQELENWCWAACTEMMVAYLRRADPMECSICGREGTAESDLAQGFQANRMLGDPAIDCRLVAAGRGSAADYQACDCGALRPYLYEYDPLLVSTEWGARRHLFEERGLEMTEGGPRVRVGGRLAPGQLRDLYRTSGRAFQRRLDYDEEGCALSWEKLKELLDEERPVAFTYRFKRRGRGHMRLAIGYAETQNAGRWVAVIDPVPPGSGEILWISYDYYRDGPFGGHWRDYWVAKPKPGQTLEAVYREAETFRVGCELEASYVDYDERPATDDVPEPGFRLSKADREASLPAAREGLESIRVLAAEAPQLMVRMWMGGNFVQLFGRELVKQYHLGGELDLSDLKPDPIPPEELVLDKENPVPIYELLKSDLLEWTSGRLEDLLRRPSQVIWEVIRLKREPFPFFSAVTVQRWTDGWRLASLGRAYLMSSIATHQFLDGFSDLKWLESVRETVDFLDALELLGPLLETLPQKAVREGALKLGYGEEEVTAFIDRGRKELDVSLLRRLAAVRDMPTAEVRQAAAEIGLDPTAVERFLEPRDHAGAEFVAGAAALGRQDLEKLEEWASRRREATSVDHRIVGSMKFILWVRELYQLFIAYDDDRLEPVYPQTFHKPHKRVSAGRQLEVAERLREVAQGVGAPRAY